MISIKKVLVPTDYSELSEVATVYGCELAARFNAELHLLYVVDDVAPIFFDPEAAMIPLGELLEDQKSAAAKALAEMVEESWRAKIDVVREVRQGKPFVEIVRYAREKDIDLIAIGTHGRGGLQHALLGSVAEKVVRKAPCPVLTVRSPEHEFVHP